MAPADELANTALEPVYDAIRRGKKIEAVKLYRQLTHAPLGEAKHAVDSMAWDL